MFFSCLPKLTVLRKNYILRLWSIAPYYLDTKGLVALWRETLLAKKVLENKTKGYKNHPQLIRFKECKAPINAINTYLLIVYKEAQKRNLNFTKDKIDFEKISQDLRIPIKKGQLIYEFNHLKKKLKIRDFPQYEILKTIENIEAHSLFKIVDSDDIETWEVASI